MVFKKVAASVTIFIFTTQIRYWPPWLCCFARLHLKCIPWRLLWLCWFTKNNFITDYIDNDDIQDNMKNSFITEFAYYPVFNTRWEIISSLTTLSALICKTTVKIISSLTIPTALICKATLKIISSSATLTTLICKAILKKNHHWLRWLHWFARLY